MTLAKVLGRFLGAIGWSFEKLAEEAGLPRNTVYRWLQGTVTKPHTWQSLIKAANALALSKADTNLLLQAARHPSVDELLRRAKPGEDIELLSRWTADTPNNLPGATTSFVGREAEIKKALALLSTARILTLTGPGGSGKSRLALEVAETALDRFTDGTLFVALAAIQEPALVVPEIAHVLGLGGTADVSPMETVQTHLRSRQMLLVLDNFEQVVDAAPQVGELLRAAPRVKALVTSRTLLHISGEHELAVPPLSVTSPDAGFEALRTSPAVMLFAERARAAQPDFVLTPENAPLVAEICTRLDGLPLAIELAAARTKRFPLRILLERFPSRLQLASGGPVDVDPRQQTLQNAIAWSYNLLTEQERTLFRRVAVFAGGFSEAAATEVANAYGDSSLDVASLLDALTEDSLLQQVAGSENDRRFEILQTIREYALERLEDSGEAQAVRRAHAYCYLDLAETAESHYHGPGQSYWLNRLALEHANFRAALGWLQEHDAFTDGLRLSTALMSLWQLHEHHIEGRAWLAAFMSRARDVPPRLRAKALLWQGLLLMRFSRDVPAALPLFDQALLLFEECGHLSGAAEAQLAQGDAALFQGDLASARERFAASAATAEQAGDEYIAARAYLALARSFGADLSSDFDTAVHYWSQALQHAERAASRITIALALNGLGEMARYRRDYAQAEEYYQRALDTLPERDADWRAALAIHNLAYVAHRRGDHQRAASLFAEALLLHRNRDYKKGVAECMAGLASVEAALGRPDRAARLIGASECLLQTLEESLDPLDYAELEPTLDALLVSLGAEQFQDLKAEGGAMPLDRAVEYATSPATADT